MVKFPLKAPVQLAATEKVAVVTDVLVKEVVPVTPPVTIVALDAVVATGNIGAGIEGVVAGAFG